MLINQITSLRDHMRRDGVSFSFAGFMTEEVLTGIAHALKKKLEIEKAHVTTARGVFSIVVEMSQNIIRYSAETEMAEDEQDSDMRYGVMAVGREDDAYFVICGNIVRVEDAERLASNLEHVQGLDKDGLKALYKQTLRDGPPPDSKGAGVGFIEIAMRATKGFEYEFQDLNGVGVFFALKARL
ncbi:SiaB family protein kinase [Magnetospira sp. QH-2]|uniref:SiaB family protein kinase n=1 Tax=Magnetospira sp. (strain QH-2) TaxID=1288970 RepID=UPI0003E816B3|nr:SiaB family protein kinase [Magnetospira sp. QH-2]CCQ75544.1 conserved protein of unknown function [Magnetospira sp. QH-2]